MRALAQDQRSLLLNDVNEKLPADTVRIIADIATLAGVLIAFGLLVGKPLGILVGSILSAVAACVLLHISLPNSTARD